MRRFDELAPAKTTQGSTAIHGTIAGEDAFKLYDTFGFPDRSHRVDGARARLLGGHRRLRDRAAGAAHQSQEERQSRKIGVGDGCARAKSGGQAAATPIDASSGYDSLEIDTAVARDARSPRPTRRLMLRETPFYAESGGQISDRGEINGDGWRVDVDEVRKVDGRIAAIGKATGKVAVGKARATVPRDRRRDTERNHTATHLLHAALRQVLGRARPSGGLTRRAGSAALRLHASRPAHCAAADRGREHRQSRNSRAACRSPSSSRPYTEAVAAGAMALFGEKYGDVVRVVTIPGFSVELCGGTHVRNTAEIALFKIVSETGVAAGVRRIEAVTGRGALELFREPRARAQGDRADGARAGGSGGEARAVAGRRAPRTREASRRSDARAAGAARSRILVDQGTMYRRCTRRRRSVSAPDLAALQAMGDALREQIGSGVGVLAAPFENGKNTMLTVVTDDLRDRGVRADDILRELAAAAGGKGGGKPHMAQAGIPDAQRMATAVGERAGDRSQASLRRE